MKIDLGDDHTLAFFQWSPDRDLNPQYEGIPDVEKFGANIAHQTPSGEECLSAVVFHSEFSKQIYGHDQWTVESWEPLTLSPSILCKRCGDHGWIKEGRWQKA
jgi:hypothetical protein